MQFWKQKEANNVFKKIIIITIAFCIILFSTQGSIYSCLVFPNLSKNSIEIPSVIFNKKVH